MCVWGGVLPLLYALYSSHNFLDELLALSLPFQHLADAPDILPLISEGERLDRVREHRLEARDKARVGEA